MNSLRYIARQFRPWLLGELLGFAIVFAAGETLSILLLRGVFLILLGKENRVTFVLHDILRAILGHPVADILLPTLVGTFLFIVLKSIALGYAWRAALRQLATEQAKFSRRLFEHYLRVPYMAHIGRTQSSLQHNLNVASNQIFSQVIFPTLMTVSEGCVLLAILAFLIAMAPSVTLVLMTALGSALWILRRRLTHASRAAGAGRRISSKHVLRLAHDSLADFKSIKVLARERFFSDLFQEASTSHAGFLAEDRLLQQIPRLVLEPLLVGGLLIFYLYLSIGHASPQRVLADLTLYAAAAIRLLPAAQRAASQIQLLSFNHPDIDAVIGDLSQDIERLPERPRHADAAPFQKSMTLDAVSLRYAAGPLVLRDVSFTIRQGDKIAIVGSTGAGKTSLLNILLGLVQPTAGHILLDGTVTTPLARFRETSVAFVPQDVFLLDGTVAENIAFGAPAEEMNGDRIWAAIRRVRLEKKIGSMPDGLDTRLGTNGIVVSGGERQRIALARALYQRPCLLVLDEATSQLDAETERAILEDLVQDSPDITLIAVTHRLATTAQFDRCLEIVDGSLIEIERAAQPRRLAGGP